MVIPAFLILLLVTAFMLYKFWRIDCVDSVVEYYI
jgi:hypothetical protein